MSYPLKNIIYKDKNNGSIALAAVSNFIKM